MKVVGKPKRPSDIPSPSVNISPPIARQAATTVTPTPAERTESHFANVFTGCLRVPLRALSESANYEMYGTR